MPGFNITGSESNAAGVAGPQFTVEPRRKHRWVWILSGIDPKALVHLRSASRPSFKLDEVEMHHNQEVAYFAGKQSWEPITMTFYDISVSPDISGKVFGWLKTVVNLGNLTVALPNVYKQRSELEMVEGDGSSNESWALHGSWPASVNWSDLDYTSTDIQVVEVTLRYDRAVRSDSAAA